MEINEILTNLITTGFLFGFGLTSLACFIGMTAKKIFYLVVNMSGL